MAGAAPRRESPESSDPPVARHGHLRLSRAKHREYNEDRRSRWVWPADNDGSWGARLGGAGPGRGRKRVVAGPSNDISGRRRPTVDDATPSGRQRKATHVSPRSVGGDHNADCDPHIRRPRYLLVDPGPLLPAQDHAQQSSGSAPRRRAPPRRPAAGNPDGNMGDALTDSSTGGGSPTASVRSAPPPHACVTLSKDVVNEFTRVHAEPTAWARAGRMCLVQVVNMFTYVPARRAGRRISNTERGGAER